MAKRLKSRERDKAQPKPRLGGIIEQMEKAYKDDMDRELFKELSGGDRPVNWTWAMLTLKLGADPNLPNLFGETALMMAIRKGKCQECRELLERGANPGIKNRRGMNALQCARANRRRRIFGLVAGFMLRRINVERPNDFARAFNGCIG
jgi:hypothetical protein